MPKHIDLLLNGVGPVELQDFSIQGFRSTGAHEMPTGDPEFSQFNLTYIQPQEGADTKAYDCWKSFNDPKDYIKGEVHFYGPTKKDSAPERKFLFFGAKITQYSEYWSTAGQITVSITISAYQIEYLTSGKITKNWSEKPTTGV